ncbi:MAG: lipopolysaccharide biosynthesis protein [Bacteroidetes bacterium]|nr:lipopolysaccharide biosynthesis protein [Bacteroidota bacterium]
MSGESYNGNKDYSIRDLILLLKGVFMFLLQQWKIIISVSVVVGLAGGFLAYKKQVQYVASVSFALEDEKGAGSNLMGFASQFGFDFSSGGGGVFSGANLIELMKSRMLVERALLKTIDYNGRKITLADLFIEYNGFHKKNWKGDALLADISFKNGLRREDFDLVKDSVFGIFYSDIIKNNLEVSQPDKKVSIIVVDVKSPNEKFSKFFAEMLVEVVSNFYVEIKSKKAKSNFEILQHQTDSIRTELNAAISGVAIAGDNTFNLNPALNVKRVPSIRKQVDVQTNSAILAQLIQNLELAKVTLRKETPFIQIIDTPILPLAKSKPSVLVFFVIYSMVAATFVCFFLIGYNWIKRLNL